MDVRLCEELLQNRLEFQPIIAKMWVGASNPKSQVGGLTDSDIEKFARLTWPALKVIAGETDSTVSEMLEDYLAIYDLIAKESQDFGPKGTENLLRGNEAVRRSLRYLEGIPENTKLKRNHWVNFAEAYRGIAQLGVTAFRIESTWREHPTFDPFDFLSESQVLRILFSLEVSSLDNVVKFVEHRRVWNEQLKQSVERKSEPPRVPSAIMMQPTPRQNPLDQINADWLKSGAKGFTDAQPLPADFFEEKTLARIALHDLDLKEGVVYSAQTVWGRELEVSFAKPVVKDYRNGDRENIRTLLRAIINGRGDRAGIKLLGDIGPKIVEVKAYLAGHLRLIGCLDGNRLFLKRLDSMPDTRAGYFKRIPANFCE